MNKEVGISFLPESNPEKLQQIAREVASNPYDVVTAYEDLGYPSPMMQLHTIAQYASEPRIGPACLVVSKYPTMESVLSQLIHLEQLSPGKVFLGLAPGAWMSAVALSAGKVQQLEEAVDSFMYLLNRKVSGYEGTYYSVEPGFQVSYPTPPTVPVMVGAWGENMLAMAASNLAVSEVKIGGTANADLVPVIQSRVDRPAEQQEMGIVFGAVCVVDTDRAVALQSAKRRAAMYIDVIGEKDPIARQQFMPEITKVQALVRSGNLAEAARIIPDELARLFVFAGTPDDVIEHALSVYRAGVKRIEFGSPHGIDTLRGIELFGREVLPVLRREVMGGRGL